MLFCPETFCFSNLNVQTREKFSECKQDKKRKKREKTEQRGKNRHSFHKAYFPFASLHLQTAVNSTEHWIIDIAFYFAANAQNKYISKHTHIHAQAHIFHWMRERRAIVLWFNKQEKPFKRIKVITHVVKIEKKLTNERGAVRGRRS